PPRRPRAGAVGVHLRAAVEPGERFGELAAVGVLHAHEQDAFAYWICRRVFHLLSIASTPVQSPGGLPWWRLVMYSRSTLVGPSSRSRPRSRWASSQRPAWKASSAAS